MANNNRDTVQSFRPFFTAHVNFYQDDRFKAGLYNCLACGDTLPKGADEAISYADDYLGRWAHIACLNKIRIAVKDDKRAKKVAQNVHEAAFHAAQAAKRKTTTTTTVSSTPAKTTVRTHTTPPVPTPPTPPVQETTMPAPIKTSTLQDVTDALRATIEGEYEDLMQQALATIQGLQARIAVLESDNSKLADELSKIMISSVLPKVTDQWTQETKTKNAQMNDSALTPQEKGRCGAPKKDGSACRWDVTKTACMHHNRAA